MKDRETSDLKVIGDITDIILKQMQTMKK